jgi:hypothetical protein
MTWRPGPAAEVNDAVWIRVCCQVQIEVDVGPAWVLDVVRLHGARIDKVGIKLHQGTPATCLCSEPVRCKRSRFVARQRLFDIL